MHHGTKGGMGKLALSGMLTLSLGCGVAAHYDPPTATEESIAETELSQEEQRRRESALSPSLDDVSMERQRWAPLIREGRAQMSMGNLSGAEQSYVSAAAISRSFRKRDSRRHTTLGNLRRLAYRYRDQEQELAFIRVAEIIRADTMGESDVEVTGLTELLVDLGRAYIEQGAHDQAQEVLDQALSLRIQREGKQAPSLLPLYGYLAHLSSEQKNLPAAAEFARKRVEVAEATEAPERIESTLQLAQILTQLEEYEEAEALFDLVLADDDGSDSNPMQQLLVENSLATIYLGTDRLELAHTTIDKALDRAEGQELPGAILASLIDTRAQILAARGNPKTAEREFKRAIEAAEDAPEIQRIALLESYNDFLKANKRGEEVSAIQARIDALNTNIEARQSRLREGQDASNPAATPAFEENADDGVSGS